MTGCGGAGRASLLNVDGLWPENSASDFRVPRKFWTDVKTCLIPTDVHPCFFAGFPFCLSFSGVIRLRESKSPPFCEFSENIL